MTSTLGRSIFPSTEIGIENIPHLPLVDGCLLRTYVYVHAETRTVWKFEHMEDTGEAHEQLEDRVTPEPQMSQAKITAQCGNAMMGDCAAASQQFACLGSRSV